MSNEERYKMALEAIIETVCGSCPEEHEARAARAIAVRALTTDKPKPEKGN